MPGEVELAQKVVAERGETAPSSDVLVGKVIDAMSQRRVENGLKIAANRESSDTLLTGLRDVNIGYTDENGTRVEDQSRKNRAKSRQELYHEFSQKNFDDLTQKQQDLLINDAASVIKNLPGMASYFASLPEGTDTTAEAKRIAEIRLRNDPAYKKLIVDLFLERNDPSKPLEDKVTSAVAEEARLKKQRDTLANRKKELETEIDTRENRLKEYNFNETGKPGVIQQRILDLKGNNARLNSANNTLETEVSDLQSQLDRCNAELKLIGVREGNLPRGTAPPRSIEDIQKEQDKLKKAIAEKNQSIDNNKAEIEKNTKQIEYYEKELEKLEEGLGELKKELKKVTDELDEVESSYRTQQVEVEKLKALKALAEESWVQSLEGITKEATVTYLNNELKDALVEVKTLQEEKVKEETDDSKKIFLSIESQRFIGPDGKPIIANINTDIRNMMNQTKSVAFTIDNNHTANLVLNGAEQALVIAMRQSGMTDSQIYNLLKDPTTRAELSNTLVKDALTAYLWSGGRLSRAQIIAIHKSEWGKGMVAQAIAGRADLQAQVDSVIGKGVLNWGENLAEQLKKIDWKKFLMILLVIVGVVGGVRLLAGVKKII